MNYWLLTTEYPPFYGGGISTYCYHTAKMLAEKGNAVSVFVSDEKISGYKIEENENIRIIRFCTSNTGMINHLGFAANQAYAFASIVKRMIEKDGKPDFIEAQEYLAIAYFIIQFKLLKYAAFENIPIILTLHSPAFLYLMYNREGTYSFPNYWSFELEKSCIRAADILISPSRYIVEEIKKYVTVDESKLSIIRNPYQHSIRIEKPGSFIRNKIVFFGKLTPQKGVFEMFAYLKNMWDSGFLHPITIIGGTDKVYYPEMKTMGQIIEQNYAAYFKKGLIHFAGKIPPEKKVSFLSDAHVVIIPSMHDNLPYAAIEAMNMGKIVLASRQGGHAEIIDDGKTGFLFDHNQDDSFEKQLGNVLSLTDDDVKNIGKAAIAATKAHFSYETTYKSKMLFLKNNTAFSKANKIFPFTRDIGPTATYTADNKVPGLLSVVITYYNSGRFIHECVDTILKSSYKKIEVIIVDDGSTEQSSIDALHEFKGNDIIKIFSKKNEGLPFTRNFGATNARGEFLAFIDADDKVHADYYSKALSVLNSYDNVFFAGAWVQYFESTNNIWPTWNPEPPYILLHNSVNSSGLVYRTDAFCKAGINDPKVDYGLEDYESVINMLAQGFRGVIIPELLFYYRVRKDSMYRKLTKYKILYSYQYIAEKHAAFYSSFAAEIFNLLNANGPSFNYDNPTFSIEVDSRIIYPNSTVNKLKVFVKRNPVLKKIILRIAGLLKIKQP